MERRTDSEIHELQILIDPHRDASVTLVQLVIDLFSKQHTYCIQEPVGVIELLINAPLNQVAYIEIGGNGNMDNR